MDGKELYANADLSEKDGGPEGYGFFLYFDGEKVRITMDGREIDVYGDGYYRDDSDWYVPGYRNYPTDENVKNVTVCIAVADGPVMYTEAAKRPALCRPGLYDRHTAHREIFQRFGIEYVSGI